LKKLLQVRKSPAAAGILQSHHPNDKSTPKAAKASGRQCADAVEKLFGRLCKYLPLERNCVAAQKGKEFHFTLLT
jgi:hypothetical protein